MEKANLKALIKGIDLTDYQRALALNEFKQMESQLQSLQEERDRLIRAVESWKEEEKMWKEFNTQLEKERDRLMEALKIQHEHRALIDAFYDEDSDDWRLTEQALKNK